jgi:hypothetical protein
MLEILFWQKRGVLQVEQSFKIKQERYLAKAKAAKKIEIIGPRVPLADTPSRNKQSGIIFSQAGSNRS